MICTADADFLLEPDTEPWYSNRVELCLRNVCRDGAAKLKRAKDIA